LEDFLLNGSIVRTDDIPAHTTLLDYLRGIDLTGAQEGCAEGECGACAVVMVASGPTADGAGSRYRAVNSCLLMLPAPVKRKDFADAFRGFGGTLGFSRRLCENVTSIGKAMRRTMGRR
jgi:hypothetical protein